MATRWLVLYIVANRSYFDVLFETRQEAEEYVQQRGTALKYRIEPYPGDDDTEFWREIRHAFAHLQYLSKYPCGDYPHITVDVYQKFLDAIDKRYPQTDELIDCICPNCAATVRAKPIDKSTLRCGCTLYNKETQLTKQCSLDIGHTGPCH